LTLRVGLFAPLRAEWNGRPLALPQRRDTLRLWAYLLLHAGSETPRDKLAFALWPDAPEAAARVNLRRTLHWLDQALPSATEAVPWILRRRDRLAWNPAAPTWMDLRAFEQELEAGERENLRRAVELVTGELLTGFDDEWLPAFRRRAATSLVIALERLGRLEAAAGDVGAAERSSRRLLAIDPFNEAALDQLLRCLAETGRGEEAQACYEGYRAGLEAAFGIEPRPALRELYESIRRGGALPPMDSGGEGVLGTDALAACGADSGRHLPLALGRLIGREAELEALEVQVGDQRLVTILGPGGAGKTRLALALAQRRASAFADGAAWVDLVRATDPGLVVSTVAGALQVRAAGSESLRSAILRSLQGRELLLVLDNCEHVLGEICGLVAEILAGAPGVRIVATSREALGVALERPWSLGSMRTPDLSSQPSITEIATAEAVELFLERTRERLPDYEPEREALLGVARVCRQLDGIPLAIELAAARMTVFTVAEIEERLEDSLALLRGRSRSRPERHLTMRAAIEWSVAMLAAEERQVLRRLAVFAGSFSLEAASAVCSVGPSSGRDIASDLDQLAGKSLLIAVPEGAEPRYRMLEVIRQFGRGDLRLSGEEASTGARHAAHFLALAEQAAPHLSASSSVIWLDRLELDNDNLRSALAWSIDARQLDLGLRLVGSLRSFWGIRMHLDQESRWTASLLDLCEGRPRSRALAAARHSAGTLAYYRGDYLAAAAHRQDAADAFSELGETAVAAECLALRAMALTALNQFDEAEAAIAESLAMVENLADPHVEATALSVRAYLYLRQGRFELSRGHYEQSLAILEGLGAPTVRRTSLHGLAWALNRLGRYAEAQAAVDEAIAISQRMGDAFSVASLRIFNGQLLSGQNRFDLATSHLRAALQVYRRIGHEDYQSIALEWLGETELGRGRHDLAGAYLEHSLAIRRRIGPDWSTVHVVNKLAEQRLASGRMPEAAGLAAEALGIARKLGLDDQVSRALRTHAVLALHDEQPGVAARHLIDSLAIEAGLEQRREIAQTLEILAELAAHDGDPSLAARCLGQADMIRLSISAPRPHGAERRARVVRATIAARLDPEVIHRLAGEGRADSIEDLVAGVEARFPEAQARSGMAV
jgi:predicted ATPase/DNA-binding SARP family transcriptional activator